MLRYLASSEINLVFRDSLASTEGSLYKERET